MKPVLDFVANPLQWIITSAIFGLVGAVLTARLQEQQRLDLEGWVTGGKSYGVLEPHPQPTGGVQYFLRHVGHYPAYDINIRLYEGGALYGRPHEERILSGTHQWLPIFGEDPPRPGEGSHELRAEISTKRENVVQYLRLEPDGTRSRTFSRKVLRNDDPSQPLPVPSDFKEPQP
jgi:hypothetical protein